MNNPVSWYGLMISVLFGLFILHLSLKNFSNLRRHIRYEIPEQLAELVRQAHFEPRFKTAWEIQVSPAMRDTLQLPLTPEYLRALEQAQDDNIRRFVSCNLVSGKLRGSTLSGMVNVTIDIRSDSHLYDYHIENVRLWVVVVRSGGVGLNGHWCVGSVEIVQPV